MTTKGQDIFRFLYKKSNMCKNALENGCSKNDEIKSERICRGMGILLSKGESYCKFLCEMDGKVEKLTEGKIDYRELGLDKNHFFNVFYILSYGITHKISIVEIIKSIFSYFKSSFSYLNVVTWFFLIKNVIFIYYIYLGNRYSIVESLIEFVPYPLLKLFGGFYNEYAEKKRIEKLYEDFSNNTPEIPKTSEISEEKTFSVKKSKKIETNIREMELLISSMELFTKLDINSPNFCKEVKNNLYSMGYMYKKFYDLVKVKSYYKNVGEKYISTYEKYIKFIKQQVKNNFCKNDITLGFTEKNDLIENNKDWVPPSIELWDTGDILITKSFKKDRFKNWKIEDRDEFYQKMSDDELEDFIQNQEDVKEEAVIETRAPLTLTQNVWDNFLKITSFFT